MSKFPPAEYNGTITAEQFLFYEIRIASKFYLDGVSLAACLAHGEKLLQAAGRAR